MILKRILCVLLVSIFATITLPTTFAGKYDKVIERIVFKKSESKRLTYIKKLDAVLVNFEAKLAKKIESTTTSEKKKSSYKKKLILIDELQKSLITVKNKITKKMEDEMEGEAIVEEESTMEDTSSETMTPEKKDDIPKNKASLTGTYYAWEITQIYVKNFNETNGPMLKKRKEYIDAILKKNPAETQAEQYADLYIGKAPLSLEKWVRKVKLTIDNKEGITGQMCQNKQRLNGVIEECEEDLYRNFTFNYDAKMSGIIGYDVYAEYSSNELQINRYLVDYNQWVFVYAKYANAPMGSNSSYFEADIFTQSVSEAKAFDEAKYLSLIKKWNKLAVSKRASK